MAHESKIEWTEATWNPWHGCHKVSQGCKNCYMFRDKARYGQDPNVVVRSKTKFYDPLKWSEPRTIFTCSWSDFFIEEADAWRAEAFAIMALTPQHTYQVLTKRPERMLEYLSDPKTKIRIAWTMGELAVLYKDRHYIEVGETVSRQMIAANWTMLNVHLGVSVEDQKTADERIPLLLQTPAAIRWLSIEPLLGPVDLNRGIPWKTDDDFGTTFPLTGDELSVVVQAIGGPRVDWIVAGGESGPDARPMHPDWVRSIRDQCTAAKVPFFFKQWGEWADLDNWPDFKHSKDFSDVGCFREKGFIHAISGGGEAHMVRVGKTKAGRTLDGRTWDEMPEVSRS